MWSSGAKTRQGVPGLDQRNNAVLQLPRRESFGVNVADFLDLQSCLQSRWIVHAAADRKQVLLCSPHTLAMARICSKALPQQGALNRCRGIKNGAAPHIATAGQLARKQEQRCQHRGVRLGGQDALFNAGAEKDTSGNHAIEGGVRGIDDCRHAGSALGRAFAASRTSIVSPLCEIAMTSDCASSDPLR